MNPYALALALSLLPQGPELVPAGPLTRLVDRPEVHVGLRPALYLDNEAGGHLELGIGFTVQVTGRVF